MAKRGWIKYCKESSGDLKYLREIINKGRTYGIKVLMGDEANMDKGLLEGSCGIVPVSANYEPETFIKIYQAVIEKNLDELQRMQDRIFILHKNLLNVGTCWISGLKYALACKSIGNGRPLSPLQPLSEKQMEKIKIFVLKNSDTIK